MRLSLNVLTVSILLLSTAACGNAGRSDSDDSSAATGGMTSGRPVEAVHPGTQNHDTSPSQQTPANDRSRSRSSIAFLQRPEMGYRPDAGLKDSLNHVLERIIDERNAGPKKKPLERMTTNLYALFNTLTVTARALDRDGRFTREISDEVKRFREADRSNNTEAGHIMNGMTGVYSMYALLAKMKFVGQEKEQQKIQAINDETVATFSPDLPVVKAAAAIAEACYTLTRMIMGDIDTDNRFEKAFTQIERQYLQGKEVAKREEDFFINGIFRTFEISQLWALSLNPERQDEVSRMNTGVSDESAEAENVGIQMAIAVKYLFLISYTIAEDTVQLTL